MENIFKPGTAILWRSSLPIIDVVNLHRCRAQVAFFMEYAFLNVYAPSGSNNRNERAIFFSRELFRSINLYPGFTWIMGGDFNCVLSPLDVENGIGFDQKSVSSYQILFIAWLSRICSGSFILEGENIHFSGLILPFLDLIDFMFRPVSSIMYILLNMFLHYQIIMG